MEPFVKVQLKIGDTIILPYDDGTGTIVDEKQGPMNYLIEHADKSRSWYNYAQLVQDKEHNA